MLKIILFLFIAIVLFILGQNIYRSITRPEPKIINYDFTKDLAVSDNDKKIAFTLSKKDQKEYIYTANIDGTEVKQVPHSEGGTKPSFSKDNTKLVFITHNGDLHGDQSQIESMINVVNLPEGSLEESIALKGYNIWEVVFSPDGKGVYFINSQTMSHTQPGKVQNATDFNIYYMSLDSQKPAKILNFEKEPGIIKNLQVLKDSTIRYLAGKNLLQSNIYQFNEGISNPIILYSSNYVYDSTISDDGSMIAISEPTPRNQIDNWTFNLYDIESKRKVKLSNQGLSITSPKFLNNSDKLMFFLKKDTSSSKPIENAIDQGKNYELMQINQDGSNLKRIDISMSSIN